ncbi:MAG: hypothetical protein K6G40_05295 [Eubacterium sp.]|nr:hypothetical protein [Eubacterium sp.]
MKKAKEILFNVRDNLELMGIFLLIAFIAGCIIITSIIFVEGDEGYFPLGTMFAAGASLIYAMSSSSGNTLLCSYYLSLGARRREFCLMSIVTQIVVYALTMVTLILLCTIEEAIGLAIFGSIDVEFFVLTRQFLINMYPAVAFIGIAYFFFTSAITIKFGRGGMYANLVLWIFICMLVSNGDGLIRKISGGKIGIDDFIYMVGDFGRAGVILVSAAVLIVAVLIYWIMIRKVEVRS